MVLSLLLSCAHGPAAVEGGWQHSDTQVVVEVSDDATDLTVWLHTPSGTWRLPGQWQDNALRAVGPDHGEIVLVAAERKSLLMVTTAQPAGIAMSEMEPPGGLTAAAQATAEDAETAAEVASLQTAVLARIAALGGVPAAEPWPRAVTDLTPEAVPWTAGSGLDALGWQPAGAGWSSFAVTTLDGSVVVHGWQDRDGDGVPAQWTATGSGPVVRVTGAGVR